MTRLDSRFYHRLTLLAGLCLTVAFLWYFSKVVVYILIALFLSLLGRPVMTLLKRIRIRSWRMGSSLAASITLLLLFVAICGFVCFTVPLFMEQLAGFTQGSSMRNFLQFFGSPLANLQNYINDRLPGVNVPVTDIVMSHFDPVASIDALSRTVAMIAGAATDLVVGLFCVFFITFFFLEDDHMFSRWIMVLVPDGYEQKVKNMMQSIYTLQVRYMVGITVESAVKFLLLSVAFLLFGMSYSASLIASLLCALLNVIPYVGPLIGGALAVVIGVASAGPGTDCFQLMMLILIALVVFQFIDNIVLQPYIYASSVKAHPLEIFLVIIMAGYAAGIVGMLLAIPAYTIIRVLAKEFLGRFKVVRQLTTNL